tara:strand:+ start:2102 stop:2956 length:855 start_codon:yes stop_codon:yes gene_type:complete
MNHPAELAILAFLEQATKGKAKVDQTIIDKIALDVKEAVARQFAGSTSRNEFKLRMSNIGRKKCQLWFDKNSPEDKEPFSPYFLINMLLGDIVEAVFKGLMRASKVKFEDNGQVVLKTKHANIKGEYDMVLDNKIDDIKSASSWSYDNKFKDFTTLKNGDSFGYVAQLTGYAKAADKDVGGWWVINKNTGSFKYVEAENLDTEKELTKIEDTVAYLENDEPFKRCFEDEAESYYGKPSGNRKLGVECSFCQYKNKCWENLQALPSKVSKSKIPPTVYYTHLANA